MNWRRSVRFYLSSFCMIVSVCSCLSESWVFSYRTEEVIMRDVDCRMTTDDPEFEPVFPPCNN